MHHNKQRNLFLITDAFPWGRGEKTFVSPELEYLNRVFNITIISCANKAEINQKDLLSIVPSDIKVVNWQPPTKPTAILLALKFIFSKAGWCEFIDLKNDGFSLNRLKDSIACYVDALSLRSFCKKRGFFSDKNSIFYSFWFNSHALALAIEKDYIGNNIKVISRIHGYDLYNHRNKNNRQPFQRYKRDNCDKIFFVSQNSRDEFEKEFGKEKYSGQYVVSRLGVAQRGSLCDTKKQLKEKILVSCSSVIPLKRVDLIAEALVLLGRKDIRWIHFGDGPLLEKIKGYLSDSLINAEFIGHVNNAKLIDFYKNNSISAVILVSETEGSPVCLQEAISFGIPIIGTDVGGIPEMIDGNGILLDRDPTIEDIADAIARMCDMDEDFRDIMEKRSFEIWDMKFNLKKNKKEFMKEVLSLLN